jgi:hypothetical protein
MRGVPVNWRKRVEREAALDPIRPNWLYAMPLCSETCPHHDGKRCAVMGIRAPSICEPAVREMTDLLDDTMDDVEDEP